MELLIVKNGHVYARANDELAASEDVFELRTEAKIPAYPAEDAGRGKYWDLDYVENVLSWVRKDRTLTVEERMESMEVLVDELRFPLWKQPQGAHDAYPIGSKVTHNDQRYVSNVDANVWEPGVYGWDVVLG